MDVETNVSERAEAASRAQAIVQATTYYADTRILTEVSENVIGTVKGLAVTAIEEKEAPADPWR